MVGALLATSVWGQTALPQGANTVFQFNGFSIAAPAGEQWSLLEYTANSALFGRRTESGAHTFIAMVMSDKLSERELALWNTREEYFEFMKKLKRASLHPDSHRFIEDEYTFDRVPAPGCMRYRLRAEEIAMQNTPERTQTVEAIGINCVHPDSLRTYMDISYTERGIAQTDSAAMRAEAEAFIGSFRFAPLK